MINNKKQIHNFRSHLLVISRGFFNRLIDKFNSSYGNIIKMCPDKFDDGTIRAVGMILNDNSRPLTERFRALFTLKNIGGGVAIDCIAQCFADPSALLKHELAYCLGQMQDHSAVPVLVKILRDVNQEAMVRHEAGEALGAIGAVEVADVLAEYSRDPVPEVAETCQIALHRIDWMRTKETNDSGASCDSSARPIVVPYTSVDPAPPCPHQEDVATLRVRLLDEKADLFSRYRAMFSLRNLGDTGAVQALAEGLQCSSALFRHEIAFVLGQIQHPAATSQLSKTLRDHAETAMVRHECAEALGAIATPECMAVLREFSEDEELVVKQSCIIALDMYDYENSPEQFQYADGLARITSANGHITSKDDTS